MLQSDPMYPGWVQGWGVVKGDDPASWEFAGIFETREDAEVAAAKAGTGFEARWGSYDEKNREFVSGPL